MSTYLGFQLPPLPQGWTEHIGPTGQPYYYNSVTQESTYVRPIRPTVTPTENFGKQKDRPLLKTPIPGTDWLKVTTTEGNVFYCHKIRKESVWVIPDELKSALEAREDEIGGSSTSGSTNKVKRKAEHTVLIEDSPVNKKVKLEEDDSESQESTEEEGEEEDWQREAAQQLAKEAEDERKRIEDLERETEERTAQFAIPNKVDLSIEEGKALFKTLLREKDINPLHPWDTALPKFISDPRYVLLPSVAARREAFDEYCKERTREIRQSTVRKERETSSPKDEFDRLLHENVKSTRASWTDVKRSWKKDRRFYGWGRDDREREKRFRDFLKELGEQKRAAVQRAESDFFSLLKEHNLIAQGIPWKEAKKIIYKDARYDAVGSSSLREELFDTFIKGKTSRPNNDAQPKETTDNAPKVDGNLQAERRSKAIKDREHKIKAERQRLDADIERSKIGINKEEGERTFRSLLTDAIREPQVTWDNALPQLQTDSRFTHSPLPLNHQLRLFQEHISHLHEKQLTSLHGSFEAHAPSLASKFNALPLDTILSSLPAVRLGYDAGQLETDFDKWQRERTNAARISFNNMLEENSFVEFWGRLGKLGAQNLGHNLQIEGDDIGENDDEKVDMKALAKNVDIKEMEKVLKNDKRYTTFDHIPDVREEWIREYLLHLSAPKLSVHVDG